jgi:hypothetical protein
MKPVSSLCIKDYEHWICLYSSLGTRIDVYYPIKTDKTKIKVRFYPQGYIEDIDVNNYINIEWTHGEKGLFESKIEPLIKYYSYDRINHEKVKLIREKNKNDKIEITDILPDDILSIIYSQSDNYTEDELDILRAIYLGRTFGIKLMVSLTGICIKEKNKENFKYGFDNEIKTNIIEFTSLSKNIGFQENYKRLASESNRKYLQEAKKIVNHLCLKQIAYTNDNINKYIKITNTLIKKLYQCEEMHFGIIIDLYAENALNEYSLKTEIDRDYQKSRLLNNQPEWKTAYHYMTLRGI